MLLDEVCFFQPYDHGESRGQHKSRLRRPQETLSPPLFLWEKIGPELFNLYHDRLDPNRLMRPTARRSGDTVYIGSCQSLQLLKLLVQHCIEPGIVDNQLTQDLVQDQGSILEAGEVLYNTSVDCQ